MFFAAAKAVGDQDAGIVAAPVAGLAGPRLAAVEQRQGRGVRFTNWYANSPVCSPSRAALLTGRYPQRADVSTILGGKREHLHRAALLDAHTAARLDTARIVSLVAGLLAAHGEWPPVSR
jgi:arylsulfatase A-like enzyme